MAWNIEQRPDGKWDYSCLNTAYGSAGGTADTLPEAKVRLAIAEADLFERPFPKAVQEVMLADPERFAADYPDPKGATHG